MALAKAARFCKRSSRQQGSSSREVSHMSNTDLSMSEAVDLSRANCGAVFWLSLSLAMVPVFLSLCLCPFMLVVI